MLRTEVGKNQTRKETSLSGEEIEGNFMELLKIACQVRRLVQASYGNAVTFALLTAS